MKNGRAHLRAMLETLPDCYIGKGISKRVPRKFPRPLDVEKWWALQSSGFAALDPARCDARCQP